VRELENILERAVALCDDHIIHANDLSLQENLVSSSTASETVSATTSESMPYMGNPNADEQQIRQVLEETRWNRKAAAELLGITYRQFRYRMKKLNLD